MAKTFAIIVASLFSWNVMAADALFERMQGSWNAQGQRTQSISGRKTRIEARVHASVKGDTLYSHSELTETPADAGGSPRTYVRDYWIRATANGAYEFGIEEKVTAVGHFDGSTLTVEQNLGGESGYIIRSQTRFNATGSEYDEVFWSGTRQLAQTHLRYWIDRP